VIVLLHLREKYMPKKKLTKKQVDKLITKAKIATYDLLQDKLQYSNSLVPMSQKKLLELNNTLLFAQRKIILGK